MKTDISESKIDQKSKQIWPPEHVKGIKELNRDLFRKEVQIPFVIVTTDNIPYAKQLLKPYLLKISCFIPIQECDRISENGRLHKIYLNPDLFDEKIKNIVDLKTSKYLIPCEKNCFLNYEKLELKYENFNYKTVLRSIFTHEEHLSSFSTIGHIIHLNLRDHMLPYKKLIGQVLIDKIKGCRLVVNKLNTIDSKFRNFPMEILAQDPNDPKVSTVVSTRESEIEFKFDFARVYWNPRLSEERVRILRKLQSGIDTVYDVFAGVGPFSLAAAKLRKCRVLCNDLNPDSYHWLLENVKLNKVEHLVKCFNLDGRDFIRNEIKKDLIDQINSFDGSNLNRKYHVLMNLPEIAFEFLDEFNGLLSEIKDEKSKFEIENLIIHCYCFLKNVENDREYIIKLASKCLEHNLLLEDIREIYQVRKVSPNKFMYRLSFKLNKNILYGLSHKDPSLLYEQSIEQPLNHKRLKVE